MGAHRLKAGASLVLLCVFSLAACGGSNSKPTTSSATAASTTTSTNTVSASASNASPSKAPVVLALVSYKIPGSDSLSELTEGANAAAAQINSSGGIGGRKVVIDPCNSMLEPAAATVCAHRTLADHAVAEFGCEPAWSAAGLPVYAAAGIPSVNCANTPTDYHNPMAFGLNPSAIGQQVGAARFVCSLSNVHTVVSLFPDVPQVLGSQQLSYQTLHACGKTTAPVVLYPLTAVDVTPYVTKVAAEKPDFILFSGIGAQVAIFFKALAQAGIPADHVAAPDVDFVYSTVLKPAGSAMNGAYAENQFDTWGDSSNPDVAHYLAAFTGSSVDPRDPTVAWGYSDVMFLYAAAKAIGFDKFNSASLVQFLHSAKDFPIPLSLKYQSVGPPGYPQENQPYIQISQWKSGKMTVVPVGDNGWVYGFPQK
jgi:branched-chain amino acid transport system substrate-binding protein